MMRIGRDGCSWQWKCITVSCRGLLRDLTGARSCWRGGGAAGKLTGCWPCRQRCVQRVGSGT